MILNFWIFFKRIYQLFQIASALNLNRKGITMSLRKTICFGYILGVPGLDFGKAITFDSPKALLVEDLDSFFELNSEFLDEEYNPEKIYVYIN